MAQFKDETGAEEAILQVLW